MRSSPPWFRLDHYQYLLNHSCHQWYLELSMRRELKASYELRKEEPKIFLDNSANNAEVYWEVFLAKCQAISQSSNHEGTTNIIQPPAWLQRYVYFNVVPLFDITHWHEINQFEPPSNEELRAWVFPDENKHIRYIVADAKKALRLALLECDALRNLKIAS